MQQRRRGKAIALERCMFVRAKPKSRFPRQLFKNRISFLQYRAEGFAGNMRAKSLPARATTPGDRLRCCAVALWHVIIMETPRLQSSRLVFCLSRCTLLCWFSWINTSTHIPGWRIEWERLTERERRERKKVAGCNGRCWMLMVGTSGSGADVISLVQMSCDQLTHLGQTLTPQMWPCRSKKRTPYTPENDAV